MGSRMRSGALRAALVLSALASFSLYAEETTAKADPIHGKVISYTCLGCHGVPGLQECLSELQRPGVKGPASRIHRLCLEGVQERRALV